ncbi:MAG TPA: helix-turn-helix domain-containing protein [Candidatus Kapabacteria bacterium]|nr:helix-turn-helix domain-containing protein [Candidatus Kapabacteria bacterium]
MIENEVKLEFVKLRASGLSYEKISQELKISKSTLIKWSKELSKEIANLKFFEMENLIRLHQLSFQEKATALLSKIKDVYSEIEVRPLQEMTVKELIEFHTFLRNEVAGVFKQFGYHTDNWTNTISKWRDGSYEIVRLE